MSKWLFIAGSRTTAASLVNLDEVSKVTEWRSDQGYGVRLWFGESYHVDWPQGTIKELQERIKRAKNDCL